MTTELKFGKRPCESAIEKQVALDHKLEFAANEAMQAVLDDVSTEDLREIVREGSRYEEEGFFRRIESALYRRGEKS